MHPGGRHDELIGGVAGRKCREAHCVGDDFWSEREDVHVAGDGVVEPCFEIAVEGQLAELRLLASHSLMALSPNVSLASARIRPAVPEWLVSRETAVNLCGGGSCTTPRAPRPSARDRLLDSLHVLGTHLAAPRWRYS